jgi:hypothetical protein
MMFDIINVNRCKSSIGIFLGLLILAGVIVLMRYDGAQYIKLHQIGVYLIICPFISLILFINCICINPANFADCENICGSKSYDIIIDI